MNGTITLPTRDADHERVLGVVFNISPAQASVLSCLSRTQLATADELLGFTGVKSNIKVVISRTRHAVREHGFDINSKKGVGYWMTAEDQSGVVTKVNEFMGGSDV